MDDSVLKTFTMALDNDRKVKMIYEGKDEISERTVKVLKIDGEKIYCYCYLRRRKRAFDGVRVLSAVMV